MIEPYPDSVLPADLALPASQTSANFSNMTEDRRAAGVDLDFEFAALFVVKAVTEQLPV